MNGIKSIKDIAVEGKRVFVRVDFNVPLVKKVKYKICKYIKVLFMIF